MGFMAQAKDVFAVPMDLVLGRYPPFVTGGSLPRGHVPVFVFHSLEPQSFGAKLGYLADNGYVTLSADEYLGVLTGQRRAPERAVVLTFDDARGSVWSVGWPLLKRYGMRGLVFLIPGRTPSPGGPARPTWDDVQAGHVPSSAVLERETTEPFLSWAEVDVLSRSGLFDFGSHTHRHLRIATSAKVLDFLTPARREGYAAMDVPLVPARDGDLLAEEAPLGTPILASAPRTSESLRFIEEPETRQACAELVRTGGGERFFDRSDWRRELGGVVASHPVRGRFETPAEQSAAILHELEASRAAIEERINRPVCHLCYPWHASGPTARRLARGAGYATAFCGKVPGTPLTLAGGNVEAIARIGEDYVELLPGRGRGSLTAVLARKWARRFHGRP